MAPSAFLCAPEEPQFSSCRSPRIIAALQSIPLAHMCAAVRRLLILPRRWLWVSLGERDVGPAATAYAASARSDPYWAARAVSSLLAVVRLRRGSVKMSHGINRNSKQTCCSSAPSFWLLSA